VPSGKENEVDVSPPPLYTLLLSNPLSAESTLAPDEDLLRGSDDDTSKAGGEDEEEEDEDDDVVAIPAPQQPVTKESGRNKDDIDKSTSTKAAGLPLFRGHRSSSSSMAAGSAGSAQEKAGAGQQFAARSGAVSGAVRASSKTKKSYDFVDESKPIAQGEWSKAFSTQLDELIAKKVFPFVKFIENTTNIDRSYMGLIFEGLGYGERTPTDTVFRARNWTAIAEYTKEKVGKMRNNVIRECKRMLAAGTGKYSVWRVLCSCLFFHSYCTHHHPCWVNIQMLVGGLGNEEQGKSYQLGIQRILFFF
jgi:hypothetical protein